MKKKKEKSTVGRTLHYYWQEIWRYKWYCLGILVSTPVAVFVRGILMPLIVADLIGQVSDGGIPEGELWAVLLPRALGFVAVFLVSSMVIEKLRLWFCWKMEIKAMYNLATKCFDALSEQSMQFHNDRFGGLW